MNGVMEIDVDREYDQVELTLVNAPTSTRKDFLDQRKVSLVVRDKANGLPRYEVIIPLSNLASIDIQGTSYVTLTLQSYNRIFVLKTWVDDSTLEAYNDDPFIRAYQVVKEAYVAF